MRRLFSHWPHPATMAVHWPSTRAALLLLVLTLTRCTAVSAGVCNQLPVLPSDIVCRVSVRGVACCSHSHCSLPHTHIHSCTSAQPIQITLQNGHRSVVRVSHSVRSVSLAALASSVRACVCVCVCAYGSPYDCNAQTVCVCNETCHAVCLFVVRHTHTNSPPKPKDRGRLRHAQSTHRTRRFAFAIDADTQSSLFSTQARPPAPRRSPNRNVDMSRVEFTHTYASMGIPTRVAFLCLHVLLDVAGHEHRVWRDRGVVVDLRGLHQL
jgi:hypothetical protein